MPFPGFPDYRDPSLVMDKPQPTETHVPWAVTPGIDENVRALGEPVLLMETQTRAGVF